MLTSSYADQIIKHDGRSIVGRIVRETDTYIVIRTVKYGEISLSKSQIKEIKKQNPDEVEGDAYFVQKEYNLAVRSFRRALAATENENERKKIQDKIDKAIILIEEISTEAFREKNRRVREHIERREYDDALKVLDNIRKHSDEPQIEEIIKKEMAQVYFRKAKDLLNTVRPHEAEKELLRSIAIYSDDFEARFLLATILAERNPMSSRAVEEFEQGIALAQSDASESELIRRHNEIADLLYEQQHYNRAIDHYRFVLDRAPTRYPLCRDRMVNSYIKLGEKYTKDGDYNKTVESLQAAINGNANSKQSRNFLGTVFKNNAEYDKAIEQFNSSLLIDGSQKNINYLLGICFKSKNDMKEAARHFEREILINPYNYDAYCDLATIYGTWGDYYTAVDHLESAIEKNSDKHKAFALLGNVYYMLRKYELAKKNLAEALLIKEDLAGSRILMGRIAVNEEDYKTAVVHFAKVKDIILGEFETGRDISVEDKKFLAEAFTNIGLVNYINEYLYSALGDLEKAIFYNDSYPDAYHVAGRVHRSLKEYDLAEEKFLKAIELNPEKPNYYLYLGILYHNDFKQLGKALRNYREYILRGGSEVEKVNKWIKECGGKPVYLENIPSRTE